MNFNSSKYFLGYTKQKNYVKVFHYYYFLFNFKRMKNSMSETGSDDSSRQPIKCSVHFSKIVYV